jgi:hypothetical protein
VLRAGVFIEHVVVLLHVTLVAAVPPTVTVVFPEVVSNPTPVIVTVI